MDKWYSKTLPSVFQLLRSSERGLSEEEVVERRKKYGPNQLPTGKADSLLLIFVRQFRSPLIYVLLLAGVIVLFLGETIDGVVIAAVLFFNAIVGTIQEGKAQNTLLALKKFVDTKATVLRDDREIIVRDIELVPGDVIILQEGEKIPADARVISATNLKLDQAALTGESVPIHKIPGAMSKINLPTAEQKNMVFKGTNVLSGSGRAVIVATGSQTVIGKISQAISVIDTEIPLKADIRRLSRLIIIVVAIIAILLFGSGVAIGKSATEMFATVVSLAVSIIPEGLPVVLTLVLASGVWRMSKRNALVKKMQAVEALGQAKVIAVDKTGTITKNEMMIQRVYVGGRFFEISGAGYDPKGEAKLGGRAIDAANHPDLTFAGKIATFCANARVIFSEEDQNYRISGDPTEAAMLVLGQKLGFHKEELEREMPLVGEIPFDFRVKYHATVHGQDGHRLLSVVGAPEIVLGLAHKIWRNGKTYVLSAPEREELNQVFSSMSQEGLRVVALAETKDIPAVLVTENIKDLSFVGFFGMADVLRPEAAESVSRALAAGIKVVMITGDHKLTAEAVAREAGIYREGDQILTGLQIDELSEGGLQSHLDKVTVFARVTPEHKLRIINAYKARGEVVAMTGDGVNDAPSLIAADLGVAMGKIGTEVAKEASDIVLLDDNFGSIVSAVEEGRSIYLTIKRVILYLFSTSWGEVLTITLAIILGFPLPILPTQIIWLNFVTDGFLNVALAMEPKSPGLLRDKFTKQKKYLVDWEMFRRMMVMALPMMVGTIFLFSLYFDHDLTKAWTVSLTTLAVFQWFNAWNCRHESKSIFQTNFLANKFLLGAMAIVIGLQLLAVYNPWLQKFMRTSALNLSEWILICSVAASIIFFEEIRKMFRRRHLATV